VTFWTEGGSSIGMGHVMRCVHVARALESEELPLHFLVNNERPVIERLNSEALFHITYPLTGAHASHLSGGVVVIDTKRDVNVQVRHLKEDGKKVVLIDNRSSVDADAVVMPTPLYSGGNERGLFSGSDYIIIGDNFRKACTLKTRKHSLPLKVLVTMGGSDPFDLTAMVLKALHDVEGIEVTVVIGPAFRNAEGDWPKDEKFRFVRNVKDMAPLMREAHIGFTAMGTTVFELAYMGVPSVIIGNYADDRADLDSIRKLGICLSLGFYMDVKPCHIKEAVDFFRNERAYDDMSINARRLTDGKGVSRIAGLVMSLLNGLRSPGEEMKWATKGA